MDIYNLLNFISRKKTDKIVDNCNGSIKFKFNVKSIKKQL